MKAPDIRYYKATSLEDVFAVLEQFGDDAVILAGGQSLLPGLNMRLSAPGVLVDIGALEDLKGIAVEADRVRIGALTRHCELLESADIARELPLLARAVREVGHVAIRNRGTFGGSLAYADPAAELPACLVALGGTIKLVSRDGGRDVAAESFFTGLMEADLRPGEVIAAAEVPLRDPAERYGFAELSRRHGDFALAGVAAVGRPGPRFEGLRVVYFGCADHARLATGVGEAAMAAPLPTESWGFLQAALERDLIVGDSPGCRADTKLQLAGVLTERVLNALQQGASLGV